MSLMCFMLSLYGWLKLDRTSFRSFLHILKRQDSVHQRQKVFVFLPILLCIYSTLILFDVLSLNEHFSVFVITAITHQTQSQT